MSNERLLELAGIITEGKYDGKINWDIFNNVQHTFNFPIMRGEEKTLSDQEAKQINGILHEIETRAKSLDGMFNEARERFKARG